VEVRMSINRQTVPTFMTKRFLKELSVLKKVKNAEQKTVEFIFSPCMMKVNIPIEQGMSLIYLLQGNVSCIAINIDCITLNRVLSSLDSKLEIHFEIHEKFLKIIQDNGFFELPMVVNTNEKIEHFFPVNELSISFDEFMSNIRQTNAICSKDEMRPVLTGSFLNITDKVFVGTDSYSMIKSGRMSSLKCSGEFKDIIFPSNVIDLLLKYFDKNSCEQVTIENEKIGRRLKISFNNLSFVFNSVYGTFPQYQSFFFSDKSELTILTQSVNVKDLIKKLNKIKKFTPQAIFDFDKNLLSTYSQTNDKYIKYSIEFKCISKREEVSVINVNAFLAILKALDFKNVVISYKNNMLYLWSNESETIGVSILQRIKQ
jgi:hypothetical protein